MLGLSALAASVAPVREERPAQPQQPSTASEPLTRPRTVAFEVKPRTPPQTRTARVGEAVVVSVSAPTGGVVTIPRLGRTASAQPEAPARFDLLVAAAGRYEVLVAPPGGETQRAGTLVTRD